MLKGLKTADRKLIAALGEITFQLTFAVGKLSELLNNPDDAKLGEEIRRAKSEGQRLVHDVSITIDKSFITSMDLEDIHLIAHRLADVLDVVGGASWRATAFRIHEVRPDAVALAQILVRAVKELVEAIRGMREPKLVLAQCVLIKRLEEEADLVYGAALGQLFNETDPVVVLKWKDVYDRLERAVDRTADVGEALEGFAIKHK